MQKWLYKLSTQHTISASLKYAFALLLLSTFCQASSAAAPTDSIFNSTDRLIIKWKPTSANLSKSHSAEEKLSGLNQRTGISMASSRKLSHNIEVVQLPSRISLTEANTLSHTLLSDQDIEYAEPDRLLQPQLVPNDWAYSLYQWHYFDKNAELAAANLPGAWDITTGNNNIVIAVLDTGILPHSDLIGRTLPGYDFINNTTLSNDGDGRDNDPTDPGDWVTSTESTTTGSLLFGCPVKNSSWHGTHVAGTIGAKSNDGIGAAGINWVSKIVPVRILGKCGGYLSDIADAMRWSAGLSVIGAPVNANPAQVINMSLGGAFDCSTSPTYQNTINELTALGVSIVVAAGNNNLDAAGYSPAGCDNVITVAAANRLGGKASYSNHGSKIEITAPGGQSPLNPNGIFSTLDGGTTNPIGDNAFSFSQGTSMAAPHVAGVVSLMQSAYYARKNTLLTPAQVSDKLMDSSRPFPTATGSDCNISLCGAGLLDAQQAIAAVTTPPVANAGIDRTILRNHTITLSGADSTDDGYIVSYQWTQLSGTAVTLANASAETTTFTAPSTLGTLSFRLTATDDLSYTNTTTLTLEVVPDNTAPVASNLTTSTSEDSTLQGSLLASDNENNVLTFQVISLPSKGSISITNATQGTFSYTPNANIYGNDAFTFRAYDGEFYSNTATVAITITPQNDPPIAYDSAISTVEDNSQLGTLSGTDIDSTNLEFIVLSQGTLGSVTLTNSATGAFEYTPHANANGIDGFTYQVSDGSLRSNTSTVTVSISPVNDPTIVSDFTFSLNEDNQYSGLLNATDPDNDPISYSITSHPQKGSITISNPQNGAFTYTPNSNANGSDSFSYTATDGKGSSAMATATIQINPINDTPQLNANTAGVITTSGSSVLITLEIIDPDISTNADQHSITISPFTLGTLTATNNEISLFAASIGQETLLLTVTDNAGASSTLPLVITINDNLISDSNHDGITDSQAIVLGLTLTDTTGDSDGDQVADNEEVGDPFQPVDSDNDNIIDALEIGQSAYDNKVLAFKVHQEAATQLKLTLLTNRNIQLSTEDGLSLYAHNTGNQGIPIMDMSQHSQPDTTYNYPYGVYELSAYTNTPAATIKLSLPNEFALNSSVKIRSVNNLGIWQDYANFAIDTTTNSVLITLTDNNSFDANSQTNIIHTSFAIAIAKSTGNSLSSITTTSSSGSGSGGGSGGNGGGGGGHFNGLLFVVLFLGIYRLTKYHYPEKKRTFRNARYI